jgi:ribosomal protein S18 acetylase RimI-like enzyme
MKIEILPVNKKNLTEYGKTPISFEVNSKIQIRQVGSGLEGLNFKEVKVAPSFVKDYDQEEKPIDWLKTFKMENWRIFRCTEYDECVGGAVVALKSPEVHMLDGRQDLAMIWDIRVKPEYRRRGVGSQLFQTAARWSKDQGCRQLKIETQNNNVKACRFYAKQGCILGEINFFKYLPEKNEIMFCWYLDLLKFEAS